MLNEPEAIIDDWMVTAVRDGGIERYDDLHIDQVDPRWQSRELWLQAGLEAYRIALFLRGLHKLDLTIVLALSLESGEQRRGVDFNAFNELQAQLDWSPPSLYLFRKGGEPWTQTGEEFLRLDCGALFEIPLETKGCYYLEFKQPDATKYSRSVSVAG